MVSICVKESEIWLFRFCEFHLIGSIHPEAFNIVVFALVGMKNMHDHVGVVQDNPARCLDSFFATGKNSLFGELFLQIICQRVNSLYISAVGNDKIVRDGS